MGDSVSAALDREPRFFSADADPHRAIWVLRKVALGDSNARRSVPPRIIGDEEFAFDFGGHGGNIRSMFLPFGIGDGRPIHRATIQPLDLAGIHGIFVFRVQLGGELDEIAGQLLVFLAALFGEELATR